MELFSGMTDNQLALLGCAAALIVSGALMSLSVYLGRSHRNSDPAFAPIRSDNPLNSNGSNVQAVDRSHHEKAA